MRLLTISAMWQTARRIVPFIRISGKWLAAAGFHPGQRIIVHVETGKLTIIAS